MEVNNSECKRASWYKKAVLPSPIPYPTGQLTRFAEFSSLG